MMRKAIAAAALIAGFGVALEAAHALTYTWITKETSGPNLHRAVCHYTLDETTADLYDMYRYKCEQTAPIYLKQERPDPWHCCGPYFGWYPITGPFTDTKLLFTEMCPQEIQHDFESELQYCDGFMHICNSPIPTYASANLYYKICKE